MELVKIIITDSLEYIELIKNRFSLEKKQNLNNTDLYEGIRNTEEGTEKIVLLKTGIQTSDISDTMDYVFDNYIVNKIINIGLSNSLNNIDLKSGDIVIPNAFIDSELDSDALFLDNSVGNNYDLNNFGLILNGICLSKADLFNNYEKNIDFTLNNGIDIYDNVAFSILSKANEKSMLENCLVIKGVIDHTDSYEKDTIINNSLNILELIL
ncbi:MAG: hypothetical protein PHS49_05675 [Candidatus Gracilibacteria bacterium]|nr:hypothetical protein [Candidatus Gracilibacteria bacterium]